MSTQDLDDFNDQINELIIGIKKVLELEMPRLKGQERTEVISG